MRDLFVDTSGWAYWISPTETFHTDTVALVANVWETGGRLITTTYVLSE